MLDHKNGSANPVDRHTIFAPVAHSVSVDTKALSDFVEENYIHNYTLFIV
jgi:hypothetical protein